MFVRRKKKTTMIGICGSIAREGLETEPVSRSPSLADGSPSDLNHAADVLSKELKNVGLDEEKMMSVPGGGDDSKEEEDGVSENESEALYPVRPGAEDCAFYMRTGSCKFGSTCKFNHPLPNPTNIQVSEYALSCLYVKDCFFFLINLMEGGLFILITATWA